MWVRCLWILQCSFHRRSAVGCFTFAPVPWLDQLAGELLHAWFLWSHPHAWLVPCTGHSRLTYHGHAYEFDHMNCLTAEAQSACWKHKALRELEDLLVVVLHDLVSQERQLHVLSTPGEPEQAVLALPEQLALAYLPNLQKKETELTAWLAVLMQPLLEDTALGPNPRTVYPWRYPSDLWCPTILLLIVCTKVFSSDVAGRSCSGAHLKICFQWAIT